MMTLEHRRLRRSSAARSGRVEPDTTARLWPSSAADTFEEDCGTMLQRLAGVGIEHAIVVELTPPDFDVSVVRVVVPGLEGYRSLDSYTPGPRGRRSAAGSLHDHHDDNHNS
jgi:ribosomal protein S12 methylthiotransferase accessory factor YcaO